MIHQDENDISGGLHPKYVKYRSGTPMIHQDENDISEGLHPKNGQATSTPTSRHSKNLREKQ